MEKSYAERVIELKNEIVNEIREIVPVNTEIHFTDDEFYVHYVDGEIATTEICKSVAVSGQMVSILVKTEMGEQSVIDESTIFGYETDSLIDLLDHTKKAVRKEKIAKLRRIVENAGGEISFDGKFQFNGTMDEFDIDDCRLTSLRVSDGKIILTDIWMDMPYENDEDFIETDELDRMIAYVEEKTKESFALTDEQNAAVDELAKAMRKVQDSGLTILYDFAAGELAFLNANGHDIKIVPKDSTQVTLNDMTVEFQMIDYLWDPTLYDIVLD